MLDYKYNEKTQAELIIQNGFGTKNINGELKLLAKYYRELGLSPKERENALYKFCEEKLTNYNKVTYFTRINAALNYAKRKDSKLIEIEEISIYKNELDFINNLDLEIDYKKIIFTLMVIDKLNKTVQMIKRGTVNDEHFFGGYERTYKELLSYSKVNLNSRRKNGKTIHSVISDISDHGLVEIRNRGIIRLNFMYLLNDNDEVVMTLKHFTEIGYYYDLHIGTKKIKECECCGVPIKMKTNRTKYCEVCSKEKELDSKRKWWNNKNH